MDAKKDYLNDLAMQVVEAPYMATAWHNLYFATQSLPMELKQQIYEFLASKIIGEGPGGLYLMTFAHAIYDSSDYLRQAVEIAIKCQAPIDAGLSLMHTIFAHALKQPNAKQEISAFLKQNSFDSLSNFLSNKAGESIFPSGHTSKKISANRIAIVTPNISVRSHAPSEIVAGHSELLANEGYEVTMFGLQEFNIKSMPMHLGVPRRMVLRLPMKDEWSEIKNVSINLASTNLSVRGRWKWLLQSLYKFDPTAVFFIGPYSPILKLLFSHFPVLGLGTNVFQPLGPLDIWLAPKSAPDSKWEGGEVGYRLGYEARFFQKNSEIQRIDREVLRVPKTAVVVLTSGTRLNSEIPADWFANMLNLLNQFPNVWWLVCGLDSKQSENFEKYHPHIRGHSYEKNFEGLVGTCDIYLNPPRIGGGSSVVTAMSLGIPVVSLGSGDGGEKVLQWAAEDVTQQFVQLSRLIQDKMSREVQGRAQRSYANETLVANRQSRKLLNIAIEDARRLFLCRTSK